MRVPPILSSRVESNMVLTEARNIAPWKDSEGAQVLTHSDSWPKSILLTNNYSTVLADTATKKNFSELLFFRLPRKSIFY